MLQLWLFICIHLGMGWGGIFSLSTVLLPVLAFFKSLAFLIQDGNFLPFEYDPVLGSAKQAVVPCFPPLPPLDVCFILAML